MLKPNNYDNTQATGEYTPVKVGGHYGGIKKVEETKSKAGNDMLAIALDFLPRDSQGGYMAREFARDIRPNKKWPKAGRVYIVVTDKDGNCSKRFKSFIRAVERSNPGFQVQWGDNFGAQFKGKEVGVVYGKVESEWNGTRSMRVEPRWFCDIDKVEEATVPEPVLLPDDNVTQAAPAPAQATTMAGFVNVPDTDLEEVPF